MLATQHSSRDACQQSWRSIRHLQIRPADCRSRVYFFSAANMRSTYCCDGISQLLQQCRGTVSMTTCVQHWNLTSTPPSRPQDVALGTAVVKCHMHDQRLLISRPITRSMISRWAKRGGSPVLLHCAPRQVRPLPLVRVPHRERSAQSHSSKSATDGGQCACCTEGACARASACNIGSGHQLQMCTAQMSWCRQWLSMMYCHLTSAQNAERPDSGCLVCITVSTLLSGLD